MGVLIFIAVFLIIVGIAANQIKKSKEGRIMDESVTVKVVAEEISKLRLSAENSNKNTVGSNLHRFLKDHFVTVGKGIDLHGIKVDFIVGNKVVVMLEMQKTLAGKNENISKVVGNIDLLQKNGYKDKILVLVPADASIPKDDIKKNEIVSRIEGCKVLYKEINIS